MSVEIYTKSSGSHETKHGITTVEKYIDQAVEDNSFARFDTPTGRVSIRPTDITAIVHVKDNEGSTEDEG